MALCTSNKQRRLLETGLVRILEREIRHVVEGGGEVLDRDAELLMLAIRSLDEIRKEELADRKGLNADR